ncbi:MAG: FAD-binding protein [Rhodobacteraceae bacterium]|nr:FAD-binding protein [Paracoccaceae bacterium]
MKPGSEAELAETIAAMRGALRIVGGGTRGVGCDGEVLETSELRGVELYEPGALTVVAKAGTPLAEIESVLAAEGQRLPFEPADHRALLGTDGVPTIGGVVATNVSGPRRIQAGACRDSLIGVRFVDGSGTVIKNGGRVMKNVTGYDLVKLMCGSYGTLGVLSEVAFKVLPDVETVVCVLIEGLSDAAAVRALCLALASPFEVTGAAHTPSGIDGEPVTMIRVEGFEESVVYRAAQLQALLAEFGESSVETNPARVAGGWRWVRDVEAFAGCDGDVWRISVKPTDGPRVGAALEGARLLFDWGGGLVWAETAAGTDVRGKLTEISGHATLMRGDGFARFQPEEGPLAAISAGLRAQFDPRGILNAGVMG